jgi:hypothetical protein
MGIPYGVDHNLVSTALAATMLPFLTGQGGTK